MSCLGLRGVYSRGVHGFLEGLRLRNGFRDLPFFRLACCALRCLACCDLCGLTLGESCPCFQFVVLLLDAAMQELRVRVGALLDVLELLIFWLAGRIQSKEGSKTLVFKGERYVKVFSQAFCFESVFLRASVAFGVLQQLCSCIVKSLSAATQCAGAAVAIAKHYPLVCAFSKSSVPKDLDFAAAQVSGFWKVVCVRAAAAFIKALAGRFVGYGLFSYLLSGILEDLVFLLWTSLCEGGHVLGLRTQRAARIVELTVRARQALVHEREAGHRLASSPAVGSGEQATGRVDVPGEARNELYKQNVAAAPFPVALQHASVLTERYGGCLESGKKTVHYSKSLYETSLANLCLSGFPAKLLLMSCLLLSLMLRVFLLSSFI